LINFSLLNLICLVFLLALVRVYGQVRGKASLLGARIPVNISYGEGGEGEVIQEGDWVGVGKEGFH
jgi:hypothetical protein